MSEPVSDRAIVGVFGPWAWSEKYTYTPGARAGKLVFLSGTTGTDENNQIVGPGDIVAQTRQIYRKFEQILRSVGASCEDIIQTTDHIVTTENYKGTAAVRREFIRNPATTATGVIVAGLLREGALIEISAVAVIPETPR
jgi:enamine deaminase RidA (YjgF/YER057c/UK114 family)